MNTSDLRAWKCRQFVVWRAGYLFRRTPVRNSWKFRSLKSKNLGISFFHMFFICSLTENQSSLSNKNKWKINSNVLPYLSKIANDHASVPSERMFSSAGRLLNKLLNVSTRFCSWTRTLLVMTAIRICLGRAQVRK